MASKKSGGTDEKSGPSIQDELRFQIPSRAVVRQLTSPGDTPSMLIPTALSLHDLAD